MKPISRLLAGALLAGAGLAASGAANAQSCDRVCLTRTMDRFLTALQANAPARAGLASGARLIANQKPITADSPMWTGHTTLKSRQTFADPTTEQVVSYGAAEINGQLQSFYVRLKVTGGKIGEVEIFYNGGEPGSRMDPTALLEPDMLYEAPVPPARRSTREGLVRVVTAYLDGISQHDPSKVPFSPRCDRYSAGHRFTNNLEENPRDRGGGTCGQSLENLKGQTVVNRRFSVVDPALGVVAAEFIIPHAERDPKGATNVAEVFKIVDGKIRSIEEFSNGGGYPPNSGFSD